MLETEPVQAAGNSSSEHGADGAAGVASGGTAMLEYGLAAELQQKLRIAPATSSALPQETLAPLQKLLVVCGQEVRCMRSRPATHTRSAPEARPIGTAHACRLMRLVCPTWTRCSGST